MADTKTPAYARALALGAICGLRSMMGPALVASKAPPAVKIAFRLLAVGELVGDKLPQIPSRIAPGPLTGRLLSGAAVGYVVSRDSETPGWLGALLGGAAAVAGAYGGYYGRKALGERLHLPDPLIALAEDALAAGIGRRFNAGKQHLYPHMVKIWWGWGVIVPLTVLFLVYFLGPWRQDVSDLPFERVQFEEIVIAIQAGTLRPDARGIIVLPARWANLTKDGKVYVTRDSHGIQFILLPTFRAGAWFSTESNFGGDVYATRPLTGLKGGTERDSVTLIGPLLAAPQCTAYGSWTVGQTDAYVEKKIDAHWYEVYTDND